MSSSGSGIDPGVSRDVIVCVFPVSVAAATVAPPATAVATARASMRLVAEKIMGSVWCRCGRCRVRRGE